MKIPLLRLNSITLGKLWKYLKAREFTSHVMSFKNSAVFLVPPVRRSSTRYKMKTKVGVRPAVPSDIPTILDFIQQLANFEKCPEQVLATHATLAKTLGLETEPTAAEVSIDATQLRPGQFAKCVIAQVDG